MKKLHIVWLAVIALIVVISLTQRGEATRFYGMAETRECSAERP